MDPSHRENFSIRILPAVYHLHSPHSNVLPHPSLQGQNEKQLDSYTVSTKSEGTESQPLSLAPKLVKYKHLTFPRIPQTRGGKGKSLSPSLTLTLRSLGTSKQISQTLIMCVSSQTPHFPPPEDVTPPPGNFSSFHLRSTSPATDCGCEHLQGPRLCLHSSLKVFLQENTRLKATQQ